MRPSRSPLRARRRSAETTSPRAAETLETRIFPAVTLLMDYTLDTVGFFNDPRARTAMESVAAELGSRLNDKIDPLPTGFYTITNPSTFDDDVVKFSAPADTLRVFGAGSALGSNILGQGGSRTNLAIRRFDIRTEFEPYVSYIGFGTDWEWNFDGTNTDPNAIDFRAVARHELMHALGIGQALSWDSLISNGRFIGNAVRAANGGVYPTIEPFVQGHFAQGAFSLMQPALTNILRPTTLDWAALDDIGWDVTPPGLYADVIGRGADGVWYATSNSGEISTPFEFGRWNESLGWTDVSTGDFNADGLKDYVGRNAQGQWYVGLNGTNGFQNTLFGTWSAISWRDVKFADFNADGRTDVVGRAQNGSIWVGLSTGTSFDTSLWNQWDSTIAWRDVGTGDFNADGLADLVGRTPTGAWWVAFSDGTRFVNRAYGSWAESAGWNDVRFADINGDQRTDVVGRTNAGAVWVGINGAADLFSNVQFTTWAGSAGWRDVTAGDFTGDGRVDLLGRTAAGQWWVAENTGGTSFVNRAFGTWSEGAGWRSVMFDNFFGDSRRDVLARTATGQWWLGVNNGTRFVFQPYGQWSEAIGWRFTSATDDLIRAESPAGQGSGSAFAASASAAGSLPLTTPRAVKTATATTAGPSAFMKASASRPSVLPNPGVGDDAEDFGPSILSTAGGAPAHSGASLFDLAFGDAGLLDSLAAA